MRPSLFLLAAFFAVATAAPAFALSIDRESAVNEDGTAKFADPDEQDQSLLNTPLKPPASSQASPGNTFSLAPNAHVGLSVNHVGPAPQPDAFDQAYDHLQGK